MPGAPSLRAHGCCDVARISGKALVVLCRGLFTPGYNEAASGVTDNVHGAGLREQQGSASSLTDVFAEVQG